MTTLFFVRWQQIHLKIYHLVSNEVVIFLIPNSHLHNFFILNYPSPPIYWLRIMFLLSSITKISHAAWNTTPQMTIRARIKAKLHNFMSHYIRASTNRKYQMWGPIHPRTRPRTLRTWLHIPASKTTPPISQYSNLCKVIILSALQK